MINYHPRKRSEVGMGLRSKSFFIRHGNQFSSDFSVSTLIKKSYKFKLFNWIHQCHELNSSEKVKLMSYGLKTSLNFNKEKMWKFLRNFL